MFSRSSIDQYIYRATLGLPQQERVDTSAELRVHLNARVKQLLSEGFPREEAQHLAVQEMGPVAQLNKTFLGHGLTNKLGWLVLVGLLAFASTSYVMRYRPTIKVTPISADELNFLAKSGTLVNPEWTKFSIKPPIGARRMDIQILGGNIWAEDSQGEIYSTSNKTFPFQKSKISLFTSTGKLVVDAQSKPCKSGFGIQAVIRIGTPGQSSIRPTQAICMDPGAYSTATFSAITPPLGKWLNLQTLQANSASPATEAKYRRMPEKNIVLGVKFLESDVIQTSHATRLNAIVLNENGNWEILEGDEQ